jgi:hypothetical protein
MASDKMALPSIDMSTLRISDDGMQSNTPSVTTKESAGAPALSSTATPADLPWVRVASLTVARRFELRCIVHGVDENLCDPTELDCAVKVVNPSDAFAGCNYTMCTSFATFEEMNKFAWDCVDQYTKSDALLRIYNGIGPPKRTWCILDTLTRELYTVGDAAAPHV